MGGQSASSSPGSITMSSLIPLQSTSVSACAWEMRSLLLKIKPAWYSQAQNLVMTMTKEAQSYSASDNTSSPFSASTQYNNETVN